MQPPHSRNRWENKPDGNAMSVPKNSMNERRLIATDMKEHSATGKENMVR